tara:strand:+ start:1430 stop:2794 length:1365 start_codon:yes stop_codon:yes gene_type:complete
MNNMHTDLPKTVNEALKILAYNDYFWANPSMIGNTTQIKPHPKDKETIKSLAEAQYAWTEKQAKLALVLLKRYVTKFQAHGIDIKYLVDNPQYDEEFRVINFEKSIEKYTDEDGVVKIEIRFPYNKKIIQLVRTLKDRRDLPINYAIYDGEKKIWTFTHSDVTAYYLTLIAARYDFKFIDDSLLNDYDEIKKEIVGYKKPSANVIGGEVVLSNAPESMQEYWNTNVRQLPLIQQVDSLKNFGISAKGIRVEAETMLGRAIAHNDSDKLWIDNKLYNRDEVVQGLKELGAFPLIMPVTGDITTRDEVEDFWNWLNAFKRAGIDIMTQCSWGFDAKEPVYQKDLKDDWHKNDRVAVVSNQITQDMFQNIYELNQMSKQFKFINDETKIIFVRNRIPRALIKSKIKPKASLVALGGGYYTAGTDNLKRMLENLPKKLYYNDHQPSSYDWHDRIIVKL